MSHGYGLARGYNKAAIRRAFEVKAVKVGGRTLHPECRTDGEVMMAAHFYKELPAGSENCDRCAKPLAEVPR